MMQQRRERVLQLPPLSLTEMGQELPRRTRREHLLLVPGQETEFEECWHMELEWAGQQ